MPSVDPHKYPRVTKAENGEIAPVNSAAHTPNPYLFVISHYISCPQQKRERQRRSLSAVRVRDELHATFRIAHVRWRRWGGGKNPNIWQHVGHDASVMQFLRVILLTDIRALRAPWRLPTLEMSFFDYFRNFFGAKPHDEPGTSGYDRYAFFN